MNDTPAMPAAGPEGLRILVVDDDADNRRMLTRRLMRNGYRTGVACDGHEAVECVEGEAFDIVLMDYMMPRMNGIEALRRIRETYPPGALPVIMVTAETEPDTVVEALKAGANDFVAKPIEMPIVLARLAAQVERLEAQRRLAEMNESLERRVAERTSCLESEIARRKDVEARMRATQDRLQQAIAAKTRFLANMSHELRTPLNAINGFAELMLNEVGGRVEPPAFRGYVKDIHDSGRHLLDIINDILDIVGFENGKTELVEKVVPIDEILEMSCRMFACQARDNDLDLTIEPPDGALQLRCDPRLIRQAVMNLVGNAIKNTPSGGTVTVRFDRLDDGSGALVVRDTGCGIPRDRIPEMVKPFEQVDTSYTRSHGGLGLGLPLVVGIAERHDGKLDLDSDEGQGLTARIVLGGERVVLDADAVA